MRVNCKMSTIIALIYIWLSISGLYSDISIYIRLFLFGLWIIAIVLEDRNAINDIVSNKIVVGLNLHLLLYLYLLCFSAGLYSVIKLFLARVLLFSPVYFFSHYSKNNENKKIFTYTSIIWLFYCVKSIFFYIENPRAARGLAANRAMYGDITLGGGYNLAYGTALIAVMVIQYLISKDIKLSKKNRIVLTIVLLISVLLCIETVSVITIIAMFIGCFAAIWFELFNPKNKNNKKIANIFGGFCSLLLSLFFINISTSLGEYIITMTSNKTDIVSKRFYEFGLGLMGSVDIGSDLSDRLGRITSSLDLFFHHPILGGGRLFGFDFIAGQTYGVGTHSEFSDTLALYGVICGSFVLYTYFINIDIIKKISKDTAKYAYVICFLIMFIFNPYATFQSHLAYFYLLPSFVILIKTNFWQKEICDDK